MPEIVFKAKIKAALAFAALEIFSKWLKIIVGYMRNEPVILTIGKSE